MTELDFRVASLTSSLEVCQQSALALTAEQAALGDRITALEERLAKAVAEHLAPAVVAQLIRQIETDPAALSKALSSLAVA